MRRDGLGKIRPERRSKTEAAMRPFSIWASTVLQTKGG
jgi:hypothetical protein